MQFVHDDAADLAHLLLLDEAVDERVGLLDGAHDGADAGSQLGALAHRPVVAPHLALVRPQQPLQMVRLQGGGKGTRGQLSLVPYGGGQRLRYPGIPALLEEQQRLHKSPYHTVAAPGRPPHELYNPKPKTLNPNSMLRPLQDGRRTREARSSPTK